MADKPVHDLAIGDEIRIQRPPSRALVTKVELSKCTMIPRYGAGPNEPKAIATIVHFEFRDGPREGQRDYTFQHPGDRVVVLREATQ